MHQKVNFKSYAEYGVSFTPGPQVVLATMMGDKCLWLPHTYTQIYMYLYIYIYIYKLQIIYYFLQIIIYKSFTYWKNLWENFSSLPTNAVIFGRVELSPLFYEGEFELCLNDWNGYNIKSMRTIY